MDRLSDRELQDRGKPVTERLLTVQDVAALVGLSDDTVRQAIREGDLPATRLRRRLRIDPADLAGWVHKGRVSPRTPRIEVHAPPTSAVQTVTATNVRGLIAEQRKGKATQAIE